jgi:hypothetical protein
MAYIETDPPIALPLPRYESRLAERMIGEGDVERLLSVEASLRDRALVACCSNRLAIPQVRGFVRSSAKGDEDRIVQERGRHQDVQDRDLGRYTRQPKRRFPTEAVLSCLHSKPNCHSASNHSQPPMFRRRRG